MNVLLSIRYIKKYLSSFGIHTLSALGAGEGSKEKRREVEVEREREKLLQAINSTSRVMEQVPACAEWQVSNPVRERLIHLPR